MSRPPEPSASELAVWLPLVLHWVARVGLSVIAVLVCWFALAWNATIVADMFAPDPSKPWVRNPASQTAMFLATLHAASHAVAFGFAIWMGSKGRPVRVTAGVALAIGVVTLGVCGLAWETDAITRAYAREWMIVAIAVNLLLSASVLLILFRSWGIDVADRDGRDSSSPR